jgi:hypothetical protein
VFLQGQDRKGRGVCILQGRKHTLTQILAQQRFISYVIDGMIAAGDPQRNPEGRIVAVFELQGECVSRRCWGHLGLCLSYSVVFSRRQVIAPLRLELCCTVGTVRVQTDMVLCAAASSACLVDHGGGAVRYAWCPIASTCSYLRSLTHRSCLKGVCVCLSVCLTVCLPVSLSVCVSACLCCWVWCLLRRPWPPQSGCCGSQEYIRPAAAALCGTP